MGRYTYANGRPLRGSLGGWGLGGGGAEGSKVEESQVEGDDKYGYDDQCPAVEIVIEVVITGESDSNS